MQFKMKKIRIGIVDDHQIVIDGIVALLRDQVQFEIVGTNISAKKMLQELKICKPDVLLTDVIMPEMNGKEFSKAVKEQNPQIKIMVLSMNSDLETIQYLIKEANISGYVLKNISKSELIQAIELVAEGKVYFSKEVKSELGKWEEIKNENTEAALTTREIEIIKLLEEELTTKQIAERLFISERTVETHRKNIFRKTDNHTVLGLIKYAYLHKII
jgi:DNA-binding NarL/FixJ family response regulator